MNTALSFKDFVINEERLPDGGFRISLERSEISTYSDPKSIDFENLAAAKPGEEDALQSLRDMGMSNETPIEYVNINKVVIDYDIEPVWSRLGLEDIDISIKRIYMLGEIEYLASPDDEDTTTTDIELEDNNPQDRVTIERLKLPFWPTDIEINMNGVFDHTKFKYEIKIGAENNY